MQKSIYPTGEKREYDIVIMSIHTLRALEAKPDKCIQASSWSEIIVLLNLEQLTGNPVSARMFQESLKILKDRRLIKTIHTAPHNLTDSRKWIIKLAGGLTTESVLKKSEDIRWEHLGLKPSASYPSTVSTPHGWDSY